MKLFLTPFRIDAPAGAVHRLRTRKTESLLAYLALRRDRWVTRSEILDLFWNDAPPSEARPKLRLALHSIRAVLGEHLLVQGEQLRIENLWVDALDAEPHELTGARLLADRSEDWIFPHQLELDARLRAASVQNLRQAEDGPQRIDALLALVQLEPLNEAHHLALYRAFVAQGHRAAAKTAAQFARDQLGPDAPPEFAQARSARSSGSESPLLTELVYRLLGQIEPSVVTLHGPAGVGKTFTARTLAERAREEEIDVLFLDFERLPADVTVESRFLTALSHDLDAAPPTLVILDGVESRPEEEFAFLTSGRLDGTSLRVLLTTQIEPADRLLNPLRVPLQSLPSTPTDLRDSDAVRMICRQLDRPIADIDPDLLYRAAHASGGLPLAIKFVAQELAFGALPQGRLSVPLEGRLVQAFGRLSDTQRSALTRLAWLQPRFHLAFAQACGVDSEQVRELVARSWIEPGPTLGTFEWLPPIRRFLSGTRDDTPPGDLFDRALAFGKDWIERDYLKVLEYVEPSVGAVERLLQDALAQGHVERAARMLPILYFCLHQTPEVERVITLGARCLGEQPNPRWDAYPASLNAWASAGFFAKRLDLAEPLFSHLGQSQIEKYRYLGLTNLGLIHLSRGHGAEAATLIEASLQDPAMTTRQRVGRMNNLAKARFLANDPDAAIAIATQAVEICGDDERLLMLKGVLYFSLAELHLMRKRNDDALLWGRRALAVFESAHATLRIIQASMLLAYLHALNGEPGEAILLASEAVKKRRVASPHWAPAAACVFLALGDGSTARELSSGLDLNSQESWVRFVLSPLTLTERTVALSNAECLSRFDLAVKRFRNA